MKVYQYLCLSRTQKEHFAAMWRGWQRRRKALDQDFAAAVSLLSSTLPSQAPSLLDTGEQRNSAHGDVATGVPEGDSNVQATVSAAQHADDHACGVGLIGFGLIPDDKRHASHMNQLDTHASLQQSEQLDHSAAASNGINIPCMLCGVAECVHDNEKRFAQCPAAAKVSVVMKFLEGCSGDEYMHASVVQRLIAGACAEPSAAAPGQEGGEGVGLLGSSGVGTAAAQVALAALQGVHNTDDRMLRDYSALVLMTTWGLSEVLLHLYIFRTLFLLWP